MAVMRWILGRLVVPVFTIVAFFVVSGFYVRRPTGERWLLGVARHCSQLTLC